MSILELMAVGILVALLFSALPLIFLISNPSKKEKIAVIMVSVLIFIFVSGAIMLCGTAIYTEKERQFISEFEAQKQTIETSLANENLSGLEKLELVKIATTLNGEMARRKKQVESWAYVTFDESMYDNVTLIRLDIE